MAIKAHSQVRLCLLSNTNSPPTTIKKGLSSKVPMISARSTPVKSPLWWKRTIMFSSTMIKLLEPVMWPIKLQQLPRSALRIQKVRHPDSSKWKCRASRKTMCQMTMRRRRPDQRKSLNPRVPILHGGGEDRKMTMLLVMSWKEKT